MKGIFVWVATFVMFVLFALNAEAKQDKVTLCHNGHTITIAEPAVEAHLRNHEDDYLGQCTIEDPVTPVPQPDPVPSPCDACQSDDEGEEGQKDDDGGVDDDDTTSSSTRESGTATSSTREDRPAPVSNNAPATVVETRYIYLDACGRRVQDAYSLSMQVLVYSTGEKKNTRFIIDHPEADMSGSSAVDNISYLWYENMLISDYELSEAVRACQSQYEAFLGEPVECRIVSYHEMLSGRR